MQQSWCISRGGQAGLDEWQENYREGDVVRAWSRLIVNLYFPSLSYLFEKNWVIRFATPKTYATQHFVSV